MTSLGSGDCKVRVASCEVRVEPWGRSANHPLPGAAPGTEQENACERQGLLRAWSTCHPASPGTPSPVVPCEPLASHLDNRLDLSADCRLLKATTPQSPYTVGRLLVPGDNYPNNYPILLGSCCGVEIKQVFNMKSILFLVLDGPSQLPNSIG